MATILGKTKGGFILEITQDEVANLIGYYSRYSTMAQGQTQIDSLQVGAVIEIAKMYGHLRGLACGSPELRKTATALRVAADLIDTLPNPLTEVTAGPDIGSANA